MSPWARSKRKWRAARAAARRLRTGVALNGRNEGRAQVAIAHSLQVEFSAQHDGEDSTVLRADGPQGAVGTRSLHRLADRVENAMGRPQLSYHR